MGVFMLGVMFVHGTLGAQLGAEFGVHNTAAGLIRQGEKGACHLIQRKKGITADHSGKRSDVRGLWGHF